MRSLLDVKRAGVPLPVRVVTVEQQLGANAKPEIPRVSDADQVRWPRGGGARLAVHLQHSPDVRQVVARLISAGRAVRRAAVVKQEPPLHSRFRDKAIRVRRHE